MVDGFNGCPCTHIGRALWLIPKLILIILKFLVKEYQNYPVKDFQQDRAKSNSPVIVAFISNSTLIIDQKKNGTDQQAGVNRSK